MNNKTLNIFRVDKKQLINQLRAMQDNYIELVIDITDKAHIIIRDRFNNNRMRTKN
jgi:hypothetical protein